MYNNRIEILARSDQQDDFGQSIIAYTKVADCWAMRTENGGRENMYASRIVHENEIVYTIRYRIGIEPGMYVKSDDGDCLNIISIQREEKSHLHIKVQKTDE